MGRVGSRPRTTFHVQRYFCQFVRGEELGIGGVAIVSYAAGKGVITAFSTIYLSRLMLFI